MLFEVAVSGKSLIADFTCIGLLPGVHATKEKYILIV